MPSPIRHICLLPALACLAALPSPSHAAEPEPEQLKVMLQGESAPALRKLVDREGGTLTHDLHIIDAVGALLTRRQLERILTSPLITRYLDDLSISEDPDQEDPAAPEDDCKPRGALELDFAETSVSWRLYNKESSLDGLNRLDLSWPATLGKAVGVSVDGNPVPGELFEVHQRGVLVVQFAGETAPPLGDPSTMTLTFDSGSRSALAAARQREFGFEARFGDECSAKLIPGYDDNQGDSYYPGVIGADALHRHGVTGAGVTVAVLDSGLWEHPALARDTVGKPRVVARFDAITNRAGHEAFDESGHGTHLTSALASSAPVTVNGQPTGSFKGVAPDVNIAVVKAFNEAGQGDFLDIVRGVQWVVDHREKHNIRVLNLSFAAPPRWHYWLDPINQALMRAWAAGITVVAAAGNEGPEPMTVGSPGNLPYIITVGAVTDSWTPETRDDDYIPEFSSRGPTPSAHIKPDLVAPGGHVIGITRPGSTLTRQHPEYMLSSGDLVMTGTSQAAAVVSGVVALLLQMQPELSPDDVKCKLTSSAELAINRDGLLAYSPFVQGNGYLSASRAVTLGQTGCGNADLDLQKEIAGTDHFQGPAIVAEDGSVSLPGLLELVSPTPSEQGLSENRKWGVKDHIERQAGKSDQNMINKSPFDWNKRYFEEKSAIERLAEQPAE